MQVNPFSMARLKKRSRGGWLLLLAGVLFLLAAGCQGQVCPEGSVSYQEDAGAFPTLISQASLDARAQPITVEIGGKRVQVDRVVSGPVCNDVWSGKVYVGCDIQVPAWKEGGKPDFFKDCDLVIEPDTIVYVASHNNAPYYKGCSCHTGGELLEK